MAGRERKGRLITTYNLDKATCKGRLFVLGEKFTDVGYHCIPMRYSAVVAPAMFWLLCGSGTISAQTSPAKNEHLTDHNLLVRRCVSQALRDGTEVTVETLPEMVITALSTRIAESDPQAEVQLDLTCPSCAHRWQLTFDIVSFFWMEISAQAKRLLREVHILARAYSWREADILSLSPARRQFYLEMVT